jgi:hypothetical protein
VLCVGIQVDGKSMDGVGAEAYTGRGDDSTPRTAGLISLPKSPSLSPPQLLPGFLR